MFDGPLRFLSAPLSRRRCLCWMALSGAGVFRVDEAQGQAPEYVRAFGPRAPWNVRVEHIPSHADNRRHVEQLFQDPNGVWTAKFQISIHMHTYPVYDARESTGPTPIKTYWETNLSGKVPWNPVWKPSPGAESQLIVIDPEHGLEWDYYQVQYRRQTLRATSANLVPGDYRVRERGFAPSRTSGLPCLAMLVRPQEVKQGRIEHALSLTFPYISGRLFVPPATRREFQRGVRSGVPVGMRFALTHSNTDLDQWVGRLPAELPEATRRTARIVAQALKDYGWFITETSPAAIFQFEGEQSAGTAWDDLGLGTQKIGSSEYPRDLLDGLFSADTVTAFAPSDEYPEEWLARR